MTQKDVELVVRQRIRALRRSRGWTLESLASRSGLSASTLSRIETGNRRVALEQLISDVVRTANIRESVN